jgi:hypothetical protein
LMPHYKTTTISHAILNECKKTVWRFLHHLSCLLYVNRLPLQFN